MKKLYFSFVLFLFSSLFILSGCYTTFHIQERESKYESVVVDSGVITSDISQIKFYPFFSPHRFQFRYYYPRWYYESYWDNQWRPYYFYRFYWNGYRFGYWDYWYKYPIFYQNNWWQKNLFQKFEEKIIIPRTRNNSGERGLNRNEPRSLKPKDTVKPQDPPPGRSDGDRVRSRDEIKKDPPQQVIPRERNTNTERKRETPARTAPQNNPTREKSSNENPTKSNTTRDRGRG